MLTYAKRLPPFNEYAIFYTELNVRFQKRNKKDTNCSPRVAQVHEDPSSEDAIHLVFIFPLNPDYGIRQSAISSNHCEGSFMIWLAG